MVFGDDAKIISCAFHLKDHRNIKAKKLNSKSNDKFKKLCYRLLLCTTVAGYQAIKCDRDLFFCSQWWQGFPDRLHIMVAYATWVHLPFIHQPQYTKNEAGWSDSSSWTHLDSVRCVGTLSLLDVCQAATLDALLLHLEIKAYLTGATPKGKGPLFADCACFFNSFIGCST